VWNYFDFFLILVNLFNICIEVLATMVTLELILKSIMMILIFIKICFFLRISDGFSFLVSMLIGVFTDLKFFFIFYIMILILFSLIFHTLRLTLDDNMMKLSVFGYLVMAYRTSLGDFQLDDYKD
jgi:hypothetical protein